MSKLNILKEKCIFYTFSSKIICLIKIIVLSLQSKMKSKDIAKIETGCKDTKKYLISKEKANKNYTLTLKNRIIMKLRFFWFLKENHALVKFIEACNMQNGEFSASKTIAEINNPNDFVYSSITWFRTTDGHRYWADVDRKWSLYAEAMQVANN